jgi:voltage-gated potassium channel Kch
LADKTELSDHVIVCGFGVVGESVVRVLVEHNVKFVIIDKDQKKIDLANSFGYPVVEGDATLSKVLRNAGIAKAKAIAIVMDNDAKNLFCVLTARDLNQNIFISTRANDTFIREKLAEAGANQVVLPNGSASREIVGEITK